LKIIKTGNVLQAYCKRIGDTEWSKFGSAQTIEFSASYFFGIAVSSLDYSKKATLKAQDLAVNSNLIDVNIDIGSVGIAGSGTTSSTGAIEVTGSGYGKIID
jgi:hypothetical protein